MRAMNLEQLKSVNNLSALQEYEKYRAKNVMAVFFLAAMLIAVMGIMVCPCPCLFLRASL
jgi:predicted nucleic acid-binding Zn ribbon protein